MRADPLSRAAIAALLALLAAAPAAADGDRVSATRLPACTDGAPFLVYIVDASADDDCDSTAGGTTEAPCLCLDGSYVAMLAAGGGGAPTSADYLVKTANGSLSAERVVTDTATVTWDWSTAGQAKANATDTKVTLDLGDDGGNDSTALQEIAPINDNGGAFSEPSADKLQIDVAKLRPASYSNARDSSHAYDCEFDGSVCSWTWTADAGTSTPTSGTIDPMASVSGDPIYDLTSWPGWLLVQSDESSAIGVRLNSGAMTLATNATIVAEITFTNRVVSAATENSIQLNLVNSGDTNEEVSAALYNTSGTGYRCRARINNNGAVTATDGSQIGESSPMPSRVWLWIFKTGDNYKIGCSFSDGGMPVLVNTTGTAKTGVTTLDELELILFTADETPSVVYGVNWIRYYSSNTLAILNE